MNFKDLLTKINEWDQKIILKYNGLGGKLVTYILKFISFFGRETLWIFLIFFYLFVWYDPFLLSHISATFLIGLVIIVIIKLIVNRSRPFEELKESKLRVLERKPSSRSFPSWHSYNITAFGLLLGLFFLKSPLFTTVLIILAVLVSFSRIHLGVHYPSDVIFGTIIGIVGFLLSIYLIAPVTQSIFTYFEQLNLSGIEYRQINSMLFQSGWYLVTLGMTTALDGEIDAEAIGDNTDIPFLRDNIVWPGSYDNWPPTGPGWVRYVEDFDGFEEALREKFVTILTGIENCAELTADNFDPVEECITINPIPAD